MDIYTQFKAKLNDSGALCRMVSASHISELESAYYLSIKSPEINRKFVNKSILRYIDFSVTKKYTAIQSFIVIATPSPEIELIFNHNEKIYHLNIPPHYSDRLKVTSNIKNITFQIFNKNGYQTFPVVLPKKLLAVRSGLAKYGKNNLSYVPGMGSYFRLTVFASDLPCDHDSWQDLQLLERCSRCKACQNNCPTGAITASQILLKAERCLTYYNEQLEPFPKWIDPKSHNSIIGCMRCQNICPENKKYKSVTKEKEKFSKKETRHILDGIPFEELPERLQLKINNLSLLRYYKHLPRNLKVLIQNKLN